MRYPPFVSHHQRRRPLEDVCRRDGRCRRCRRDGAEAARARFAVLGPAPAPLGKLRGEYRAQMLIKGANRTRMREALQAALAARPDLARRTTVDVDPLSVL